MYRTDDPDRDFARWQAAQDKALEKLPKCDLCGEHIQDECYYEVDGANICPKCLERSRKWLF